jgi:hypothetical protein
MKIIITGDLVINNEYNVSLINKEVIDLFNKSDINIVNLEAPVTESKSRILKTGPHLKANKDGTLAVLKALKIDILTLANNHVLDYDKQGVLDTLAFCQENSLQSVGAGINIEKASAILYLDSAEGKIAIVNLAENEWASATVDSPGANGMDIVDNARQIKEANAKADFVFVIVHGGHEYYNLPSPRMQKLYRFYAEQGANIVVGHHTHCLSGYEVYNEVPIYYSLGNFIFTENSTFEDWYQGLILEIEIKDGKIGTKLNIVIQEKKDFRLHLPKVQESKLIMQKVEQCNNIIGDKFKLQIEWDNYIKTKKKTYLYLWSPLVFFRNRYVSAIFNRLGINFINKKGIAYYLNMMRCEAHKDLSKEVLKDYLKQ